MGTDDDPGRLERIENELRAASFWRAIAWAWVAIVVAAVVFGLVVWRLATG